MDSLFDCVMIVAACVKAENSARGAWLNATLRTPNQPALLAAWLAAKDASGVASLKLWDVRKGDG